MEIQITEVVLYCDNDGTIVIAVDIMVLNRFL